MKTESNLLLWMDLEMTGLDPAKERIIELAALLTDGDLNIVANGPALTIHQPESVLAAMDDWNTRHHTASGLVDKVRASTVTEADAQEAVLAFAAAHAPPRTLPLCGNSIWQDRRFLVAHMPRLEAFLHYRNVDVSSVKELVRRWYPHLAPFEKKKAHTALEDIGESIAELRHYRSTVFIPQP